MCASVLPAPGLHTHVPTGFCRHGDPEEAGGRENSVEKAT